jgi:hypothetical protein
MATVFLSEEQQEAALATCLRLSQALRQGAQVVQVHPGELLLLHQTLVAYRLGLRSLLSALRSSGRLALFSVAGDRVELGEEVADELEIWLARGPAGALGWRNPQEGEQLTQPEASFIEQVLKLFVGKLPQVDSEEAPAPSEVRRAIRLLALALDGDQSAHQPSRLVMPPAGFLPQG